MRGTVVSITVLLAALVFWSTGAQAGEVVYEAGVQTTIGADLVERDGQQLTALLVATEPVWKNLERMSLEEKANSELELDLGVGATEPALRIADSIEEAWKAGQFAEALGLFSELDDVTEVDQMSVGLAWRSPVTPEESLWETDVRIGTRDEVHKTAMDIHRASGNLFAVLLYQEGSNYYWAVNISTDNGATWQETYAWGEPWLIRSITAAVVADHLYLAYTNGADQNNARLFRFNVANGARENFTGGYTYFTAFSTTPPEYIEELSLVSNQDFGIPGLYRLYLLAITSADRLLFYWDNAEATSWAGVATGVTDADKGLDVSINEDYDTYWLWASYIDKQDSLCIDGYGTSWAPSKRLYIGASPQVTTIGAYHDTIHCFHEFSGSVLHCRYQVSYTGGANWLWGTVDDTTALSERPALTAREGGGVGIVWRYYTSPRQGRFTWRNYAGWPWPTPEQYTDHEPYYNQPSIEYLGGGSFGVVYLSWNTPYVRAAYFDRSWGGCSLGIRGNANNDPDDKANISDVSYLLAWLFGIPPGPAPPCLPEANANGDPDEKSNISDVSYLLAWLFGIPPGPAPPSCP